jgi:two-component system, NtrC family, response regulator GlrR
MLAKGTFREDLYHRVAVMVARIPPLRERRDDIPVIAAHFLHRMRYLKDIPPPVLKNYVDLALGFLRDYQWPGNVRELRNVVERAAILADPGRIKADAVGRLNAIAKAIEGGVQQLGRLPMRVATEQFEREYLNELLRASGRNLQAAAAIAQIHPKSLERLLRKHGLRVKEG